MELKWMVVIAMVWICGTMIKSQKVPSDNLCPDEWKEYRDINSGGKFCLRLFTEPTSWDKAQEVCNSEFGHLLTLDEKFYKKIEDIEDVVPEEIYSVLHNSGISSVWTSLRIKGGRLWSMDTLPEPLLSGSNPLLWSWATRQPRQSTGQCGSLNLTDASLSRSKLELSLYHCESQLPFICINSGFTLEPASVSHCPSGWLGASYSDKCYKYSDTELSYSDAQQACEQEGDGGHLASPNTALSYGLVQAVVQDIHSQNGIACLEYSDVSHEEDVSSSALPIFCKPNQVCQTTVELSPDKMLYSKKCEDFDTCQSNLDLNRDVCHSGDVIFQPGFTALQCFDCCNSSDCTSSLKDRGGPMAHTLANFESGMSLPSNQTQAGLLTPQESNSLEYWIGLRKQDDHFTWDSGESYNANSSHFGALYEAKLTEGCVRVLGIFWEVTACEQLLPYVCELVAKFEPVELTMVSSNKTLSSKSIQWKHDSDINTTTCQKNYQSPHLCCKVKGDYLRDVQVLWVKDGIYISNGLPPGGLRLSLTKKLESVLDYFSKEGLDDAGISEQDLHFHLDVPHHGSVAYLQGVYHCEVWSLYPHKKVSSQAVKVSFRDIKTYRGSLPIAEGEHNVSSIQRELLEWGTVPNKVEEYKYMIETLMKVTLVSQSLVPDIDIINVREGSLVIDFSVYYHLSEFERKDWLNIIDILNINLLNPYSKYAYNGDQTMQKLSWFINELEEKFLIYIRNTVLLTMQDDHSEWNMFYGHIKLTEEDLVLTSTVACPSTIIKPNREMFRFMRSAFGDTAASDEVCLSDGEPLAKLRCEGDFYSGGLWTDLVTYDKCVQPTFSQRTQQLKQLSQREINTHTAENISHQMVELTNDQYQLNHADVVYASKVVRNVAASPRNVLQTGKNILQTVNNLMFVSDDVLKNAQRVNSAATRLLESLDAYSMTAVLKTDTPQKIIQPKLALEIWQYENTSEPAVGFGTKRSGSADVLQNDSVVSVTNSRDGGFMSGEEVSSDIDVAVVFPPEVINKVQLKTARSPKSDPDDPFYYLMDEQPVRVKFAVYQDAALFLSPSQLTESAVQVIPSGKMVAGSVIGVSIRNLSEPVTMTFTPSKPVNITEYRCAFWDFSAGDGTGNWSTDGCWLHSVQDDQIICHCDHLTNFAIITQVEHSEISSSHHLALSIISVVGAILSILGLTLTVLTFILFRKLRKGISQKTLVNLAVALLCTNVVFLCGIDRTESDGGCAASAAILEYFLLASFSWMLVEGVVHYLKFVKVLDTYIHQFMIKATILAWGGPAVVVILVACIDWRLFRGHNDYCWLAPSAFYFSFVLPVCCILLVNTVLFILVIKGITCDRPKGLKSTQSDQELLGLQVKAAISCFILLGLTWIFGFLAVRDARLVFQYLFCILNSFHGFWIFLNYCVREPSVRDHWRQFMCCKYSIISGKYSHTVSSGVFSSSGHSKDKNAAADNVTSRDAPDKTISDGDRSTTPIQDSGPVSAASSSTFSYTTDVEHSTKAEPVVTPQITTEPVYENWNNFFLEESCAIAVNFNTGIPYKSSLPRNKKGFGLEGLYNDTYQNLEFNTSDV